MFFPMRLSVYLGLLIALYTASLVRADTETLQFTLPVRSDSETLSTTRLIPSSSDVSIFTWKEPVRFRPTESDRRKQTGSSENDAQSYQQQTRDIWVELDSDHLVEGTKRKVKGMIKVSWLARPSTTLKIAEPIPDPSNFYKAHFKISATYLITQQAPELIITLEPLYLGVLPSSSLPLVGMLLFILFGLRRIGAYRWLIKVINSIVKDNDHKLK